MGLASGKPDLPLLEVDVLCPRPFENFGLASTGLQVSIQEDGLLASRRGQHSENIFRRRGVLGCLR